MRSLIYSIYEKVSNLAGVIFREAATRKLKEKSTKCRTIDEHIDLALSFGFGLFKYLPYDPFSIRCLQIRWEILQLMKILEKRPPKTVLEIGTALGGTLYLWTKVSQPDAHLISIDLPEGYPEWKTLLHHAFGSPHQKIHLLQMNSHSEATLREVKVLLDNSKVDFLFIDGDHTYESVKKDFECYSSLVKRGGIIAFHDVVPGSELAVGGVPKFWKEIRENFSYREMVEDWKQGGYGIGVLYV